MLFIIAQVIGIVAWFIYLYSFYKEDTNKILAIQILASVLYSINYLLLGAFSGLFTTLLEIVRDLCYFKSDKDDLIFIVSIPIYILIAIFTSNSLIALLPIIASIIDGFSLTKNKKIVVIGGIVSNVLWVIYEIVFKSYSVALTDSIIIISNLIILFLGTRTKKRIVNKNLLRKIHGI